MARHRHGLHCPDGDELLALLGELEELAADPRAVELHLARELMRLFEADASGIAEVGDLAGGGIRSPLVVGLGGEAEREALNRAPLESCSVDPAARGLLRAFTREPSTVIVGRRVDLAPASEWAASPYADEVLRTTGICDGLYSTVVVGSPLRVSGLAIWRTDRHRPFSEDERDALMRFQRAGVGMHRRLFLPAIPSGLAAAVAALRPSWRLTLEALLAGESEKAIAFARRLSPYTVHEYVRHLYAHFGVHSRPELLALFIVRSRDA